jgi:hypothetical protein
MHMSKEKKYSVVPETVPFQMLFTNPLMLALGFRLDLQSEMNLERLLRC